jgi:hypothetical protein
VASGLAATGQPSEREKVLAAVSTQGPRQMTIFAKPLTIQLRRVHFSTNTTMIG